MEVTINAVQGVGDTYWVWQKLVRHVDRMNFRILCTDKQHKVQVRAVPFLQLLEKVGTVEVVQTSQEHYNRVAAMKKPLAQVLDEGGGDYAVNRPLEEGVRLEDIDPEFEVEWTPGFKLSAKRPRSYSIFYVSGSEPTHTRVWTAKEWARFYDRVHQGHQTLLLGAPYDDWKLHQVKDELWNIGIPAWIESCTTAEHAIRFIREAKQFVGYQSGLGILADAYDVPQHMVDFTHLRPMRYAWCKPHHIRTKFFATTFDAGVESGFE